MMTSPQRPTLDRGQLGRALAKLARYDHPVARDLYTQLASSYGHRPDRDRVTLQQLSPIKVKLLGRILPDVVVSSTRYTATYRHPSTGKEITIGSETRPPKKRTFRVPGHGSRKFIRVSIIDSKFTTKKESTMAKKKAATKSADVEEIEGLEDVEDLEDLEDTDVEEPDTEDEDDEESGLESMTLKDLKAKAREAGVKGVAKMKKPELIEALTATDDEEEEDDEDEGDEFDEMDRAALKKYIKAEEVDVTVKKSMSDDDIREAIRAEVGDDEEEDEPEEKPAKKGRKTAAKGDKPKPTPPNRELPKGKVGAERIGEIAKADARTVRVFLRGVEGATEKYKTDGRWAFTEKQAQALAKALAKKQKAAA